MTGDTVLVERLRDAADRIEVDLTLDDVLSPVVPAGPAPARRRVVPVAACALLVLGVVAALATRWESDDPPPRAADWTPPITVPTDVGEPGAFAAHVADPPDWLGPLGPGRRPGGERTGDWVATAIARPDDGGYGTPITVSAFDGRWRALSDATAVTLGGVRYLHASIGDWQALATTTHPALVTHGYVDQRVLHDVLASTRLVTSGRRLTITFDSLPAGYVEVVPPHVLRADATTRRTLAEEGGALAINEVSDWNDALLYAASTGAEITRHDIGDATAWSGTTTANPNGPITFLVWSPRPGVLLEIDSVDPGRSIDDLLELASRTTAIPAPEWDERYPG